MAPSSQEALVGDAVGENVSTNVGDNVGARVGFFVGEPVGLKVGAADGTLVGEAVGLKVGAADGATVGAPTHARGNNRTSQCSLRQSRLRLHSPPMSHPGQTGPPQSTAVSSPFISPSSHLGAGLGAWVGTPAAGKQVGMLSMTSCLAMTGSNIMSAVAWRVSGDSWGGECAYMAYLLLLQSFLWLR